MLLFLKNLLFTLVVPGTVAVYIPLFIARHHPPIDDSQLAIALPVLVLGSAIYAWCLWDFAVFGRGTPAPIDAPKKLVVRGLYRYTRNPMYIGVLTMILGWTILFRTAALFLHMGIVSLCVHVFIVLYEERHLQQEFGSDYEEYCHRVSRWLPRLPRVS